MKKLVSILSIVFILTSCGTGNLQYGAGIIASTFKADKVLVGKSFSADTQKGKVKSLTITLQNVEAIEKNGYPMDKVASVSAKLLIDNLKKEDIDDAEIVSVEIENKEQSTKFNYKITDLIKMDEYFKIVRLYLNDIENKKYNQLVNYIDTTRISIAGNLRMIKAYQQIDSIIGQQGNIKITGFNFTSVKADTDLQVVETWAEMSSKQSVNQYRFRLNNDGKPIKILGIEITSAQ